MRSLCCCYCWTIGTCGSSLPALVAHRRHYASRPGFFSIKVEGIEKEYSHQDRLFACYCFKLKMKHILKILAFLVAVAGIWISLLEASLVPRSYTWLLPVYLLVSLGCYGLLMVGTGLMLFPTCPQEAVLLQKDIVEAKEFLKGRGVDVGSD